MIAKLQLFLTTLLFSSISATITCSLYNKLKIKFFNEIFIFSLFIYSTISFFFIKNIINLNISNYAILFYKIFTSGVLYYFIVFIIFNFLFLLQTLTTYRPDLLIKI